MVGQSTAGSRARTLPVLEVLERRYCFSAAVSIEFAQSPMGIVKAEQIVLHSVDSNESGPTGILAEGSGEISMTQERTTAAFVDPTPLDDYLSVDGLNTSNFRWGVDGEGVGSSLEFSPAA